MAVAAHTTNVVRLPTAACRKVRQPSIRAVRAYKADSPWPGEYKPPYQREQDAKHRLIEGLEKSPELLLAMAIFSALPEHVKREVREKVIGMHLAMPSEETRSAFKVVEFLS